VAITIGKKLNEVAKWKPTLKSLRSLVIYRVDALKKETEKHYGNASDTEKKTLSLNI
jgi:hypothetical protein